MKLYSFQDTGLKAQNTIAIDLLPIVINSNVLYYEHDAQTIIDAINKIEGTNFSALEASKSVNIEPLFYETMIRKYGIEIFHYIVSPSLTNPRDFL